MSFVISQNSTIIDIVGILDTMKETEQTSLLRQLKLAKAKELSKKLNKAKPEITLSDEEIADIVHQHRKTYR